MFVRSWDPSIYYHPLLLSVHMMVDHPNQDDCTKMSPLSWGENVMINVKVIDDQLDYNILLGRSYMYAMKAVASSMFHTMMFPFNGKLVTLDQLSYYNPHT